jgi:hypothetical protein
MNVIRIIALWPLSTYPVILPGSGIALKKRGGGLFLLIAAYSF